MDSLMSQPKSFTSSSLPFAALAAFAALDLAACSGGGAGATVTHDAGHDAVVDSGHTVDAHVAHEAAVDAQPPVDVYSVFRMAGQRTPLSAACDPIDGTRCLLPWPNNTFTVVDSTTETGLRLNIAQQGIATQDNPASINRADGFSRVSPIETGYAGTFDTTTFGDGTTGCVRLIVEQPGSTFGALVPLRFDTVVSTDPGTGLATSLLIAYPRVPLAPNTDYAVVVMNSAKLVGGNALTADREGKVALGLAAPETAAEGALYAYDAPARAAMQAAGVGTSDAVRVWDFTTRSLSEPTTDLLAVGPIELAAYDKSAASFPDAGPAQPDGGYGDGGGASGTSVGIAIDSVDATVTGTVLMSVIGRVTNVPYFLTATGSMNRSAAGVPVPMGVHDVPFRVAVPVGTGNYRIVMYGHGLGGTYDETTFDEQITTNGAAKIGTQFIGWTATTIGDTFALFARVLSGSEIATAGLTQSLADTMVVQHALGGALGAVLGGDFLIGQANPAAGRVPNLSQPIWAGGSLGGTMGFVYSTAEPSIAAAVLNVPGAAWTQFVTYSEIFGYVKLAMAADYPDPIAIQTAVVESQTNFDVIDGAPWYDAVTTPHPLLLEQESIGDPVLPNIGNDMVAAASHADQVGVVLNPIATCTNVPEVASHNGMTQFKVPASVTAPLDIHGFAAGSSPAGVAAQQQIVSFIASVWAGSPLISVPPECVMNTPANSCDFTNSP